MSVCRVISLKVVQTFSKNFLDFRLNTIEKQGIINLISSSSKPNASIVLSDSEATFLWNGKNSAFSHLSVVFWLYTALHNRRKMS